MRDRLIALSVFLLPLSVLLAGSVLLLSAGQDVPRPPAPVTVRGTSSSSGTVTEANLTLADVTTDNCSTTMHGFTPKAPNSTTQFLNGTCAWSTPATPAQTLLGQAAATAAPGAAADLATVAISGLAAQDALEVLIDYFVSTGGEKLTITDTSVKLAEVDNNVALGASEQGMASIVLNVRQDNLSSFHAVTTEGSTVIGATTVFVNSAPATAWTGNWTIALHTSAADAAIRYRLRVYKRAGQ